ncbi:helix-turn-helix transcriptional regulator [Williamsia sterculiae]|uniref:Transcriptional regulator, XRE family with cupin sensor n=1 Tax=Williamsia sterculiae TaxID=1344003 RepID=A0A1N7E0N0_9NOCA|nr:helix-turn-helix transcriptional regulator [Williamsia sterculiae]SIR81495.1 transcriptional regulator, XRE family with cupin sensor [Williamsia sterculiae]
MKQEKDEPDSVDTLIRTRIRGLRVARGWSLDALAARCHLSPSTLSRIETGHRRIVLDQLIPLARALGTTLDDLVASDLDEDVVIRPQRDHGRTGSGRTVWYLSREAGAQGTTVAKMRIDAATPPLLPSALRVHPGRDWFTVLTGVARLQLGDRTILVEAGQAAEFDTMTPHHIGAAEAPMELITMLDHEGRRIHLHDTDDTPR